jgi:DNA-binding PadR family transcriptional regulator
MPKGSTLGELEQVVLLALARVGADESYGMAIVQEIHRRTGRDVSVGAVYSALDRMERKGLLTSDTGAPSAERGGRARRLYSLREEGRSALVDARRAYESLWQGLELSELDVAP